MENTIIKESTKNSPRIGPTTGIQAYRQFESPLVGIGKRKCMILGPKSRAGFNAAPVVPANDNPRVIIKKPTASG